MTMTSKIILIIGGALMTFIVFGLINSIKYTKSQNVNIESNPELATENAIKDYLQKSYVWSFTRRIMSLYEGKDAYYEDMADNAKQCAKLISLGAKIVLVDGTRPDYSKTQEKNYFAITPKMVLHRKEEKNEASVNSQIINGARIYVQTANQTAVVKENASVTKQAIAGAVIAGAAGAIIGAANAMETNSNGGKTKVVSTSQQVCGILFNDVCLDCIIISQDLIDKYGAPQVPYEPVKTTDCWIYTGIPSFKGDIAHKNNFVILTNYVQNILNELQR